MRLDDKPRRGFSLTELAIVLSVIGFIIGGLWVLISHAWESVRQEQAKEQITAVTNNMRAYFAGQQGVAAYDTTATASFICLVPQLIEASVIPSNMKRSSALGCTNGGANCYDQNAYCADTPWGPAENGVIELAGTFRVCSWPDPTKVACGSPTPNTYTQYFGIILSGLSPQSCIGLTTVLSGASGPPGLVDVGITGANAAANCLVVNGGGGCPGGITHTLPVLAQDAATLCSSTTNQNILRFIYKLHLPPS